MKERNGRTATAARLQFLASQLVQDLRDLRAGLPIGDRPEERQRLQALAALAESAGRGAFPAFQEREGSARGGRLTPDRSRQLASLDQDQEAFALVRSLRGGGHDRSAIQTWAEKVSTVVERVLVSGWGGLETDQQSFVETDLEAFLERMERLDESESFVPRRRTRVTSL